MYEGPITIPSCKLELREPQQGVFGLRCERIVDNYVLVVALRVGCI
jgi:hypothetical protein